MSRIHFHIDEVPWRPLGPDPISPRWKQMLDEGHGGSKEFVFGVMEIPIGGSTLVHAHVQEETIYILSGRGNVGLGRIQVELGACSRPPIFQRTHRIPSGRSARNLFDSLRRMLAKSQARI